MSVKVNTPQVAALKKAVEKRLGRVPGSRYDFGELSDLIEQSTGHPLSENTLRRIWGKIKGYDTVFEHTLDILSSYAGYGYWQRFVKSSECAAGDPVSKWQKNECRIETESLPVGAKLRIGWAKGCTCLAEYQGAKSFIVLEAVGTIMQPADTFECGLFLKGQPLFIDNLVHSGELCQRYYAALESGVEMLEMI